MSWTGLSNLKTQADIDSNGERDVVEYIPSEDEIAAELVKY